MITEAAIVLGGSWDVVSRVISTLIWVIGRYITDFAFRAFEQRRICEHDEDTQLLGPRHLGLGLWDNIGPLLWVCSALNPINPKLNTLHLQFGIQRSIVSWSRAFSTSLV